MIENAFVLAATRRLIRPAERRRWARSARWPISLPVIEEVLQLHVSPDYFQYLRHKLATHRAPTR